MKNEESHQLLIPRSNHDNFFPKGEKSHTPKIVYNRFAGVLMINYTKRKQKALKSAFKLIFAILHYIKRKER